MHAKENSPLPPIAQYIREDAAPGSPVVIRNVSVQTGRGTPSDYGGTPPRTHREPPPSYRHSEPAPHGMNHHPPPQNQPAVIYSNRDVNGHHTQRSPPPPQPIAISVPCPGTSRQGLRAPAMMSRTRSYNDATVQSESRDDAMMRRTRSYNDAVVQSDIYQEEQQPPNAQQDTQRSRPPHEVHFLSPNPAVVREITRDSSRGRQTQSEVNACLPDGHAQDNLASSSAHYAQPASSAFVQSDSNYPHPQQGYYGNQQSHNNYENDGIQRSNDIHSDHDNQGFHSNPSNSDSNHDSNAHLNSTDSHSNYPQTFPSNFDDHTAEVQLQNNPNDVDNNPGYSNPKQSAQNGYRAPPSARSGRSLRALPSARPGARQPIINERESYIDEINDNLNNHDGHNNSINESDESQSINNHECNRNVERPYPSNNDSNNPHVTNPPHSARGLSPERPDINHNAPSNINPAGNQGRRTEELNGSVPVVSSSRPPGGIPHGNPHLQNHHDPPPSVQHAPGAPQEAMSSRPEPERESREYLPPLSATPPPTTTAGLDGRGTNDNSEDSGIADVEEAERRRVLEHNLK